MSYTTQLRSFLSAVTASGFPVPAEVLALADSYDAIGKQADDVISSADNTGCSDDLTVVDAEELEALSELINSLRDSGASTQEGPSATTSNQSIQVQIEINTEDGLDDPSIGETTLAESKEVVLIDTSRLAECEAVIMEVKYPSAKKYGVPQVATRNGALAYVAKMGFTAKVLVLKTEDLGDDSGDIITLTVEMPATAIYSGSIDEAKEFAGLHWGKHFESLSQSEQEDVVNRFIQSVNL